MSEHFDQRKLTIIQPFIDHTSNKKMLFKGNNSNKIWSNTIYQNVNECRGNLKNFPVEFLNLNIRHKFFPISN